MCVALSRDGVSWLKPELGLVSWDGSSATNIVFPTVNASRGGPQLGNVFYNTRPGAPCSSHGQSSHSDAA
jgi:hypothetical protein